MLYDQMTRDELVVEINRKLALFKVTKRPADYPEYLIWLVLQRR